MNVALLPGPLLLRRARAEQAGGEAEKGNGQPFYAQATPGSTVF
ncbi:MAG: hypothetical protein RLT05_04400 [Bauldia litoralis]